MPPTDLRSWTFRVLSGALAILFVSACGGSESVGDTRVTQETTASTSGISDTQNHSGVTDPKPENTLGELDIQGHRGVRGLKPENTLPSIETALDLGVATLEFDLHLAADGEVVVWHDAAIDPDKCGLASTAAHGTPDPDDRATPPEDLMVRELDSSQLATYRCDRNPDSGRFPDQSAEATDLAGVDYSIVTLEELLDFVAAYAESEDKSEEQRGNASMVRFNMETKRKIKDPENIGDGFDGVQAGPFELRILEIIAERGLDARVTIQSFDHRSLWAIHERNPGLSLSALTKGGSTDFSNLVKRGASIWSASYEDLTESNIEAAHIAGLEVIPWTVNELDVAKRLADMGADGLISDRPDLLLHVDPSD